MTVSYLPDATTADELQTMVATGSRMALTVHPLLRQWYVLDATQTGWMLQSPTGPIAQVRCEGDRIVGAEFLAHDDAQALVRRRQGVPPKVLADRVSMLAALQPTRTRFAEQLAETVRLTERTNERSQHRAVWDTSVGCSVVATLDGDRVRSIAWMPTGDDGADEQTSVVTTMAAPPATAAPSASAAPPAMAAPSATATPPATAAPEATVFERSSNVSPLLGEVVPTAPPFRSVVLPSTTISSGVAEWSPVAQPTPSADGPSASPMSRDDKAELERALARMRGRGQRGRTPFEVMHSATASPVLVPGETVDQGWARLTAVGVHIEGKPAPVPVVGPTIAFAMLAFAFVVSVLASGGFFSVLLGGMAAFGGVKLLGAIQKGSGVVVISGTGGVIVVQQESVSETAHLAEHVTQRELGAVIDAKGWRSCFRLSSTNGSIPYAYFIYGPPMTEAPSQLTAFSPEVWGDQTARRVEISERDFHALRTFLSHWSHFAAEADRLIDLEDDEEHEAMIRSDAWE